MNKQFVPIPQEVVESDSILSKAEKIQQIKQQIIELKAVQITTEEALMREIINAGVYKYLSLNWSAINQQLRKS